MSEGSIKDFKIISKLGEGSFSQVYKVKRLSDGIEYAMKKVKMGMLKEKEKENALNEVRILASIKDENIVAFKEVFIEDGVNLCVIMEYAQGGDLQKKINDAIKAKRLIPEPEIWKFLIQMTKGLKALHDISILHRDLKCANVFSTKEGNYKLGDLNVSKIAKQGLVYTQTGTPYYASPEVWRDEAYDAKSDIWSLGCVIYEMASLKPPFRANDMEGLYRKVQKGIFDRIPTKYSTDLQNVIAALLKVNPNQRPNCNAILNNPIVQRNSKDTSSSVKKQGKAVQSQPLLNTIQLPKNLGQLKGKLPKAQYDQDKELDEEGDYYDEELLKYIYQNGDLKNNNSGVSNGDKINQLKERRKQLKSAGLQRTKIRGQISSEEKEQNENLQQQHMMRPQSGKHQIRPSAQSAAMRQKKALNQNQEQNQDQNLNQNQNLRNSQMQQQGQIEQQQRQQYLKQLQQKKQNQKVYDYNNYNSANNAPNNNQKRQEDDQIEQNGDEKYKEQVLQNYSQLHNGNAQLHQKVKVNEKKLNNELIQKRQQKLHEEQLKKQNEQKQIEMLYKQKLFEQQKQQLLKQQQELEAKSIANNSNKYQRPQSSVEQSRLQQRYNNTPSYQEMQKSKALRESRDINVYNQGASPQDNYYKQGVQNGNGNKMRPLSSQIYGSGLKNSYDSIAKEQLKYENQMKQIKAQKIAQKQQFENNQIGGVKRNVNIANQYYSENPNQNHILNINRNQGNQLRNLNQYMSQNSNRINDNVNIIDKINVKKENGFKQQNLNNGLIKKPNQNLLNYNAYMNQGNRQGQQQQQQQQYQYNSENNYGRIQSAQPSKRVYQMNLQKQREQQQYLAQKKLIEQGQSQYQQQKLILQQQQQPSIQNSRYQQISRIQQQKLGNLQNYQSNNVIPKTTKSQNYSYAPPQSANYARRNAPSGGYSNNKPSWWG